MLRPGVNCSILVFIFEDRRALSSVTTPASSILNCRGGILPNLCSKLSLPITNLLLFRKIDAFICTDNRNLQHPSIGKCFS